MVPIIGTAKMGPLILGWKQPHESSYRDLEPGRGGLSLPREQQGLLGPIRGPIGGPIQGPIGDYDYGPFLPCLDNHRPCFCWLAVKEVKRSYHNMRI